MAVNQYYSFAGGVSANALTNSAYAALTTLRSGGFVSGVASSEQVNTVLRQASTAAAGVAKFAADNQTVDVLDNGDPAIFSARLQTAIDARIAAAAQALIPPGMLAMDACVTPPAGWLICNGTEVSRITYAALFARIGTVFGSHGPTTFQLPDFRGLFPRGADLGAGVDVGRTFGSAQSDALASHLHAITGALRYAISIDNVGGVVLPPNDPVFGVPTPINTASTGGTETRPKNLAVNIIIKT